MINPADVTTVNVGALPSSSLHLTDKFPFETASDGLLKQTTIQALINFIALNASALQYEVKRLDVTQTYIDNNFNSTGLGINICTGFAICNGNNGTTPMDGLVGIAYGSTTNVIGAFGGEKTHSLTEAEMPTHSHTVNGSANDNGDPGQFVLTSPNNGGETTVVTSSTKGSGTAHNNMQPYIVQLYIMKL
jgi:hypothetical protein